MLRARDRAATPAARWRTGGWPTRSGPNYNKPWEASTRWISRPPSQGARRRGSGRRPGLGSVARSSARSWRRWPRGTRPPRRPGTARPGTSGTRRPCVTCTAAYPGRSRRGCAVRRRADEPDAVGAVGPGDRCAGRGRRHDGGQGGPGPGAGQRRRPASTPACLHMYIHLMEMSPSPRTRCRPVTCCATWSRTRATCGTCRRTSMCCAATTGGSCRPTPLRSPPTRSSWPGRAR